MTSRTARGWAIGGGVLAAAVLILAGIWQILTGFAAMSGGDYFGSGSGYAYAFSTTTWAWLHLSVGVLMAVVGALILGGAGWARLAGVVFALISATLNFLWIPIQPIWALVIIAVDAFVIWSLLTISDDT